MPGLRSAFSRGGQKTESHVRAAALRTTQDARLRPAAGHLPKMTRDGATTNDGHRTTLRQGSCGNADVQSAFQQRKAFEIAAMDS